MGVSEELSFQSVSVSLRSVMKRFGDKGEVIAIDGLSVEFQAGKMSTLLGPSGCGKSTTLKCIGGVYEPEEGEILIGNTVVNGIPAYSRPTATVFQNYALFPHMTVFENIAFGLKVRKIPFRSIQERVREVIRLLNLGDLPERTPAQLSGGQQQRVAVARALVTEPKVLLLDEPLSNLDAKLRLHMRVELKSLQKSLGITTIYVTHDQEEAMSISDVVVIMNGGRIEQTGTPYEIYKRPKTNFVAEFIGMTNYLEGEIVLVKQAKLKMKITCGNKA